MLLLFPAFITLSLTFQAFRILYRLMDFGIAFIPKRYVNLPYINNIITVTTFFVLIALIWFVGLLVKTYIGRHVRSFLHSIIEGIPFAGSIFRALRQLMDLAISVTPRTFSRVVLIEFPHKGCRSLGFITGDASDKLTEHEGGPGSGKDFYKVFVPGTPNPSSGFLIIVPKKDVILTDLTVEQGLMHIVSGGMLKQKGNASGKTPAGPPAS